MYGGNERTNLQNRPTGTGICERDGLGTEIISALCLDSLMLLCSAEHLLDHLDRR